MDTYAVEYIVSKGAPIKVKTVSAKDYTKAYLDVCYSIPLTGIIISVTKI